MIVVILEQAKCTDLRPDVAHRGHHDENTRLTPRSRHKGEESITQSCDRKWSITETDLELKRRVKEELRLDKVLNAVAISVGVKNGIAILRGPVPSNAVHDDIERAVLRIEDIHGVVNHCTIRPSGSRRVTDVDIARAALDIMEAKFSVPRGWAKVRVHDGWITTEGQVSTTACKRAIEENLLSLPGVAGVTNRLSVNCPAMSKEAREYIIRYLIRKAGIVADRIQIELRGSAVLLKGQVCSLAEKRRVERAAWSGPGVTKIRSQLKVRKLTHKVGLVPNTKG